MPFVVLYDANVLYPSTLRDLLIRVAQAGLVQAKWTDQILDSVDTTPCRDASLEPFRAVHDADLIAASQLAPRLGWACRAVNGHVRGEDKATWAGLRMFLDGRA